MLFMCVFSPFFDVTPTSVYSQHRWASHTILDGMPAGIVFSGVLRSGGVLLSREIPRLRNICNSYDPDPLQHTIHDC